LFKSIWSKIFWQPQHISANQSDQTSVLLVTQFLLLSLVFEKGENICIYDEMAKLNSK
jgi:hypothetical protein